MHPFERSAIDFIIGNSLIAGDVRAQLEYLTVADRTRDRDELTTRFAVAAGAPIVIPRDASMAADLDVDAYGEVTAYITIEEGRLTELVFEASGAHWPEHPRILGLVP